MEIQEYIILKIIEQVDMLKRQIVTRSLVKGMQSSSRWLLVGVAYWEEIVERFQDSVGREQLPKRRSRKKRKHRASFLHPWDNPIK